MYIYIYTHYCVYLTICLFYGASGEQRLARKGMSSSTEGDEEPEEPEEEASETGRNQEITCNLITYHTS